LKVKPGSQIPFCDQYGSGFIFQDWPQSSAGLAKNDCVKTFLFRKSRRKVNQIIFHLVSSPDVPDFHPLAPKSYSIQKAFPTIRYSPQNAHHFALVPRRLRKDLRKSRADQGKIYNTARDIQRGSVGQGRCVLRPEIALFVVIAKHPRDEGSL
jgi:hypothetical protein